MRPLAPDDIQPQSSSGSEGEFGYDMNYSRRRRRRGRGRNRGDGSGHEEARRPEQESPGSVPRMDDAQRPGHAGDAEWRVRDDGRGAPRSHEHAPVEALPGEDFDDGIDAIGAPDEIRTFERRRGRRGGRGGQGGGGQGGGRQDDRRPGADDPRQAAGRRDGGSRKPWEPAAAPAPVSTADGEDAANWGEDEDEAQSTLEPAPWGHERQAQAAPVPQTGGGVFMLEMGGFGTLRHEETNYLPAKTDIFVPQRLVQQHKLKNGMHVEGRPGRGQKHKYALNDVHSIDGKSPRDAQLVPQFKNLVTVDPDFHYAVGDASGETTMRIMDLLCPVGRGQRGLIVAPPRTGKTTLLRHFAKGVSEGYPDVHLFVLLVDERPEEATDWKRSATKAHVFASTSDESPKTHVQLAEAVWARCMRLVELGQDVVLLLDSITRLARAYNNLQGGGGKTMSGGLDSRAMERPRQIFGSARNTEKAGSLTILGTALVETGSKMDQLIFEEFKGTGNMEVVLSRKLADRRIFPAIDVEKSGTRKEEKLISAKRLKSVHVLRRVLQRMNFIEAMDLLVTKLDDVERTDDFLKRFETDPEA